LRKKPRDDNEPPGSSLSSIIEEKNVENNNKLRGSLSFSTIEKKKPRTMTSWDSNSSLSYATKE
jgi:hypothetical protein